MTYSAVVLTVLTTAVLLALLALYVLTRPAVFIDGGDEANAPGIVLDPDDTGVRVTKLRVVSPLPLTFVDARYRVVLPDADLALENATHAVAASSLRAARVDDATWRLTYTVPGVVLPRDAWEVFVLTNPLVRRFTALDMTVTFRDGLGRTLTKVVPALPKQANRRAIREEEIRA